jgi:hypothetical protein
MPASKPFSVASALVVMMIMTAYSLETFENLKQDQFELRVRNQTFVPLPQLPPDLVDPIFVNNTQLAMTCQELCKGGECLQDSVSGVTSCLTCGDAGMTMRNITTECVDTSHCANIPWCSTAEAEVILITHNALLSIARNITVVPMPYDTGRTQPFMPAFGDSDQEVVDRFNLFLLPLRDYGSGISQMRHFWDDQKGWWNNEYQLYEGNVPAAVLNYMTQVKTRMCVRRWVGMYGQCMSPSMHDSN